MGTQKIKNGFFILISDSILLFFILWLRKITVELYASNLALLFIETHYRISEPSELGLLLS